MARNRTLERRKGRERERRRQQQITGAVVLIVVAVIAGLALILANQPAEAPIPAETATRYTGIPQSKTDEGFPVIGNDDAAVKVVEYSSFDCPHCQEFHASAGQAIVDRVRAGGVQFTFVPIFGTGGIANGEGAARAAVCAGEQGKFWEFHDALFSWQSLYGNQAYANNRLQSGVNGLALDRGQWDQCMGSELPGRVLTVARTNASNLPGYQGTPTITVNGIVVTPDLASVTRAIDDELAKNGGTTPGAEATAEETPEETPETTAPAVEATAEETTEP